MLKEIVALLREKPLHVIIALLIAALIWSGNKWTSTIVNASGANSAKITEIGKNIENVKSKVDTVDDKVDDLTVQVRTAAGNDSTVIREQARLYQIVSELEKRVAKLEDR